MGFNNHGVVAMVRELEAVRRRGRVGATLLGVNVGKNKDTPIEEAAADYEACIEAVYPLADYLTLNLSSPNTPGLRTLQSERSLAPLLERIKAAQSRLATRHRRRVPVLLKLAPDLAEDDLSIVAGLVRQFEVDGVIAGNTTVSRPDVDAAQGAQTGGLSGVPLGPLALATVRALRAALADTVPIIGVGGIMDAAGGRAMLAQGADLLQIYTGLVYRGPALVRELTGL
jgi:dihydroorotate dehydrogenase